MTTVFVAWGISAAVLLGSAALLGARVRQSVWGVFTDGRGRFSLSQMQVVLWTVLVLSLLVGVFIGRLAYAPARSAGALDFDIPSELLVVMGISIGSAAVATAIKTNKDTPGANVQQGPTVASRELTARAPGPTQAIMVEEGAAADRALDITKFQNFWLTLILIAAYLATAIAAINDAGTADKILALPGFDTAFVTLLAISHAGYLAGKMPNRPGVPGTAIRLTPKQCRPGDSIEIYASGTDLSDVLGVQIGAEFGTHLQNSGTTLTVVVPGLQPGNRIPVKVIAPTWQSTASEALEVVI